MTIPVSSSHVNRNFVLEAALAYGASGRRIFPCNPENKKPYIKNWPKLATCDEGQIRKWWKAYPKAMIGLPTGAANGVIVIDCDSGMKDGRLRQGVENYHALCQEHNLDPESTLYANTPAGGRHYYYQNPPDSDIRNSVSQFAEDVDVRGSGGYVIAPPSINSQGVAYEWGNKHKPQSLPVCLELKHKAERPLPAPDKVAGHSLPQGNKYGEKALDGEIANILKAQKGTRNNTLIKCAFRIGQLIEACNMNYELTESKLIDAALKSGLQFTEAEGTVKSGLNSGMDNPRVIESKDPKWLATEKAQGNEDSGEPDGEAIDNILPKPPAPPMEAFPLPVRKLLKEAAQAFVVPESMPVACMLGLLSALVGRTRAMRMKATWPEHGNLWIGLVARSGSGKSPVQSAFFKPLEDMEYKAKLSFDAEYSEYEDNLEVWKAERKRQIKVRAKGDIIPLSDNEPQAPVQKQVIADDSTPEAMGDMLAGNPKGIILLKDELSGMFYDLDKYTSGKGGGEKARILSAYDCKRWKVNRSSNPKRNIDIPKACLSIFGGIQPALLARVFDLDLGGDLESGLLPRFILIRAEIDKPRYWNEDILSDDSIALLERITSRLWEWDIEFDDKGKEIEKTVRVSSEAKALFIKWHNAIAEEAHISETQRALLEKLKSQAMRLCLLLHCLDASLSGTDGMEPIELDCMKRALMLANWIKENQAQCWRLFEAENPAHIPDPIESAIMTICIEQKDQIAANGDRISNADLARLVKERLGMDSISNDRIGRAASRLGLTSCWINKDRAKSVSHEKINLFLKKSVGSVGSVGKPHESREKRPTLAKSEVLVSVGNSVGADEAQHFTYTSPTLTYTNTYTNKSPESGVNQGDTTLPTLPTLISEEKNKNEVEKGQEAEEGDTSDTKFNGENSFEIDLDAYQSGKEIDL